MKTLLHDAWIQIFGFLAVLSGAMAAHGWLNAKNLVPPAPSAQSAPAAPDPAPLPPKALKPKVPGRWVVDGAKGAGSDAATLAEAIASAQEGDVLQLRPGTYKESLYIRKDLSLVGLGASRGEVVLEGAERQALTLREAKLSLKNLTVSQTAAAAAALSSTDSAVELVNVEIKTRPGPLAVVVSGGTLSAADSLLGSGVLAENARLTLENSRLEKSPESGVHLSKKASLKAERSTISGSEKAGISVMSGSEVHLSQSDVVSNKKCGLELLSGSARLEMSRLNSNRCGVAFEGGGKLHASDSNFNGNKDGPLLYADEFKSAIFLRGERNLPAGFQNLLQ